MKGNLKDISVTNIVQIVGQSGMSGRLTILNMNQEVQIFFANGDIVEAELDQKNGEEVFFEVLGWETGEFEMDTNIVSSNQTISIPWTDLLLSGLQKLDESKSIEDISSGNLQAIPDDIGELFGLTKSKILQDITNEKTEVDMTQNMKEILVEIGQEVSGFMATAVVGMDGLGVASHQAIKEMNLEVTNAQMTMLFKLVQTSVDKLIGETVEDFLLTTDKAYLLIRPLQNPNYYLGIACDRSKANLGNMRLVSRTLVERLSDAMPR